jgi:hypothetical protein
VNHKRHWALVSLLATTAIVILALVAACSSSAPDTVRGKPTPNVSLAASTDHPAPAMPGTPTPTDVWSALLQRTPFPYGTPLPPPTRTILDGTYAKLDPKEGTPVPCKRCPDYAPEGGIWKLHLDNGVFRIYHQATGWRSIASFTVSRDRLYLFNDPVCTDAVGAYRWELERGTLTLEVIEDECAIRLRAMNLTGLPWLSCRPPNAEAAVTDHWFKPPGCL